MTVGEGDRYRQKKNRAARVARTVSVWFQARRTKSLSTSDLRRQIGESGSIWWLKWSTRTNCPLEKPSWTSSLKTLQMGPSQSARTPTLSVVPRTTISILLCIVQSFCSVDWFGFSFETLGQGVDVDTLPSRDRMGWGRGSGGRSSWFVLWWPRFDSWYSDWLRLRKMRLRPEEGIPWQNLRGYSSVIFLLFVWLFRGNVPSRIYQLSESLSNQQF